jgi:DNA end-binding protein Ku
MTFTGHADLRNLPTDRFSASYASQDASELTRQNWQLLQISFGLVTIPIRVCAATEDKSIRFRQVHARDRAPIELERVCSVEKTRLSWDEIARGYEAPDGRMVLVSDEDLASLPLPSMRVIEVLKFVPIEAIDPILFDRSYYLDPEQRGDRAYRLLRDTLHKSGRVAIVKTALRQRETLALLRVVSELIVLVTLLWPDEVRTPDFAFLSQEAPQTRPQEEEMARMLVDSLSEDTFDPAEWTDTSRAALEELIAAKLAGQQPAAPGEPPSEEITTLEAALRDSIAHSQARTDNHDQQPPQPTQR